MRVNGSFWCVFPRRLPGGGLALGITLWLSLVMLAGAWAQEAALWGYSPVPNGRISSPFGWRQDPITGQSRFHAGLDIAAEAGSPIYVPLDGVVAYAGPYQGYGNVVVVRHTAMLYTLYGHAMTTLVQLGQPLTAGDPIALVGSTGRSTGPHLHFEVRQPDGFVNPTEFLAALAGGTSRTRVATKGWREVPPLASTNPFNGPAPVPSQGLGGPEVAGGAAPVPMGPPAGIGRAIQVIRGNRVEWSRF